MILRTEIYATACIIGGIVHATAYYTFSVPLETASMMGMVVTLLIRLAAIRWHLKLPTFALDEKWALKKMCRIVYPAHEQQIRC